MPYVKGSKQASTQTLNPKPQTQSDAAQVPHAYMSTYMDYIDRRKVWDQWGYVSLFPHDICVLHLQDSIHSSNAVPTPLGVALHCYYHQQ